MLPVQKGEGGRERMVPPCTLQTTPGASEKTRERVVSLKLLQVGGGGEMTVLRRGSLEDSGRGDPERKDCSLEVGSDPAWGHPGQSSLPGQILALAGDSEPTWE